MLFHTYHLIIDQAPVIMPDFPIEAGATYFWQIIATIFGSILLWIYKRDIDRRDKREEKMAEAINTLKTNVAVLSNDVEKIRTDLDHLIEVR